MLKVNNSFVNKKFTLVFIKNIEINITFGNYKIRSIKVR